ncbi:MAG: hypothetical protein FWC80_04615 [Firmicutes bacterium]|nr:hypothetical protein [Bacillota bacterium]
MQTSIEKFSEEQHGKIMLGSAYTKLAIIVLLIFGAVITIPIWLIVFFTQQWEFTAVMIVVTAVFGIILIGFVVAAFFVTAKGRMLKKVLKNKDDLLVADANVLKVVEQIRNIRAGERGWQKQIFVVITYEFTNEFGSIQKNTISIKVDDFRSLFGIRNEKARKTLFDAMKEGKGEPRTIKVLFNKTFSYPLHLANAEHERLALREKQSLQKKAKRISPKNDEAREALAKIRIKERQDDLADMERGIEKKDETTQKEFAEFKARELEVISAMGGDSFSFERIKQKAHGGCDLAQLELGEMYRTGIGATPNTQEAVNWYYKSALQTQGKNNAFRLLGMMQVNGCRIAKKARAELLAKFKEKA